MRCQGLNQGQQVSHPLYYPASISFFHTNIQGSPKCSLWFFSLVLLCFSLVLLWLHGSSLTGDQKGSNWKGGRLVGQMTSLQCDGRNLVLFHIQPVGSTKCGTTDKPIYLFLPPLSSSFCFYFGAYNQQC